MTFRYGQRHKIEFDRATKTAAQQGVAQIVRALQAHVR